MRFTEFLRSSVLISAASATVLAVVALAGANGTGDARLALIAAAWWLLGAALGAWLGRRRSTNQPIARLLATARTRSSLPELNPARTLLNRLWPILVCTVGAGAVAFRYPQVPAIAAGFAIVWALAVRHQSSAVAAIEGRDGARFYVERTKPLEPIKLVRTPGFRSGAMDRLDSPRARRPSGVAGRGA